MNEEIQKSLSRIEQFVLLQAKEALSVDDLCLLTGWAKQTIYNLVATHQIPCYKQHGVRFKKSEINDWLLSNRQMTEQEIQSKALLHTL